jgi:hypothetical protein
MDHEHRFFSCNSGSCIDDFCQAWRQLAEGNGMFILITMLLQSFEFRQLCICMN